MHDAIHIVLLARGYWHTQQLSLTLTCVSSETTVLMLHQAEHEAAAYLCRTLCDSSREHSAYLVPLLPSAALQPVQPVALLRAAALTALADVPVAAFADQTPAVHQAAAGAPAVAAPAFLPAEAAAAAAVAAAAEEVVAASELFAAGLHSLHAVTELLLAAEGTGESVWTGKWAAKLPEMAFPDHAHLQAQADCFSESVTYVAAAPCLVMHVIAAAAS